MTITHELLIISAILFSISIAGLILRRQHVITLLMCVELMLLAVNTNFIAYSERLHDIQGQLFVFFILTVAAAEAAIGLAILVVLFRHKGHIDVEELDTLKG
jgi:NADH-quinone oxidoreductase subunit K